MIRGEMGAKGWEAMGKRGRQVGGKRGGRSRGEESVELNTTTVQ